MDNVPGITASMARRAFLAASGSAAAALLPRGVASAAAPAAPPPPPPASNAGYTRLSFADDFDSLATIDVGLTNEAGYHWYASQWHGYPATPADNIVVADSVLTLGGHTDTGHRGAALETAVKVGSGFVGKVFAGGAYFEASIAFEPAVGTQASRHWPCFWSLAIEHVYGGSDESWPGQEDGYVHFSEVDFFEAFHAPNESYVGKTSYLGAPHDWSGHYVDGRWQYNIQTGNRFVQTGAIDWNDFHTYGTLWVPQDGSNPGYLRFYVDGNAGPVVYWRGPIGDPPLPGQPAPGQVGQFTPDTPDEAAETYAIIDQRRLAIVLGTDYKWPMRCDWVRVWQ